MYIQHPLLQQNKRMVLFTVIYSRHGFGRTFYTAVFPIETAYAIREICSSKYLADALVVKRSKLEYTFQKLFRSPLMSPVSSKLTDSERRGEQVMKLLIMKFSPVSRQLISLRTKYSPQHPVLKHPQSVLLP
jgi:hypothetical protein